MIWLAWRQIRVQAAAGVLALGALAVVLGLVVARAASLGGGDLLLELGSADRKLYVWGTAILIVTPAVIGVFWGAPLVARELEAGTHRLAWSQTVGRLRWLFTKVGLGALVTVLVVGAASLLVGWWSAPVDHAISATGDRGGLYVARIEPLVFDARGIVPVSHALCAFVIGVTAGLILRRTLLAMGTTLLVAVALQVVMPLAVRQHLIAPVRSVMAIDPQTPITLDPGGDVSLQIQTPGDWLLSHRIVDRSGRGAAIPRSFVSCLQSGGEGVVAPCIRTLSREGYRAEVVVQPASRFWTLQWLESGVLLALAAALCGLCAWRIREA